MSNQSREHTSAPKAKVIGTGLSGMVGQRVVELLSGAFEFVDFSLDSGIDILDPKSLKDAYAAHRDACAVLHLAAFTDTNAAWAQRGDKNGLCYQLNVEGTRRVLDLAQAHRQYFIYISTDFVFDGAKTEPYLESDTPHPIEWYGETKYLGEQAVIESGHEAAVARITYPYRARFDPKPDIVRKVLAKLNAGEAVKMFSDQLCTHTFIDDIARALGVMLQQKPRGVYHLVGSSSQSPYAMSLKVAEVFDCDRSLVQASSLAEYVQSQPAGARPWQKSLVTSNEKIGALGARFASLEEGLRTIKRDLLAYHL